jgi:hypothetical protein
MPFVQIKSDLTNIKFGNDRPGYGSSGLPYIQFTPPTQTLDENNLNQKSVFFSPKYMAIGALGYQNTTATGEPLRFRNQSQYSKFYEAMRTGLDYPIRGGAIDFQIGQQTYTLSSKIDQSRIKAFFEDKQRGTAFIQKQIGLQLSNPKMETGNTLFGLGQGLPFSGLLENTRVYNNGVNTLAQVGVSGTGAHALRHGRVPFAPLQKHYYAIVSAQNVNNEPITNRLLNLNALKMTTSVSPFVNPQNVFDINTVNNLGISLNRNLLFQYLGGPGSAYGIGATTIPRVVDTPRLRSSTVMTYDKLKSQTVNNITNGKATTNIQDFREQLPALKFRSWGNQTIDDRFYVAAGNYKDKLNSSYPFLFENTVAPWQFNKSENDDLIKLVFEAISNDNPSNSLAIFFRAFLTAGITDNHSAQLNSFKYIGRGENFYTYQGFERSIAFSFRLSAGSQQELQPMYNRLNALVSQVYPDYAPNGTSIMRAPMVRITVGDYLYRMPGFIESINITVDNGYPWEVNLSNVQDGTVAQLPQVLDVAVSFKPIFDELPRRAYSNVGSFISANTNVDTGITTETYESQKGSIPRLIANSSDNPIIYKGESTVDLLKPATPEEIKNQINYNKEQKQIDYYNVIDFTDTNINGTRIQLDN